MKNPVINRIFALVCFAVTAALVLCVSGCSLEGKGITLDTSDATVYVGESFTLTVGSENGRPMSDFTLYVGSNIISVDESLTVTGVSEGETVITVEASDGSSAECKVTVLSHPESLELHLWDTDGYVGDVMEFAVKPVPATAVYTYTAVSSDESVVAVDGDSLIFKGEGTATLTVESDNGVTVSQQIRVYSMPSITFEDLTVSLYDDISVVTDLWGEPSSTVKLALGSAGWVYDKDTAYTVIFTDGSVVTGVYTDSKTFTFGELAYGQSEERVEEILDTEFTNGHSLLTYRNELSVEVYFDLLDSGASYAFFLGGRGCNDFVEPDEEAFEGYAEVLFGITNSYRRERGLAPFEYYDAIEGASYAHCADMIENDFVGHTSSDGRKLEARMNALNIGWHFCAENIAAGYKLPFSALAGLINSEGHRENIVSEKYLLTGISVLYSADSKYGTYVTQIFCTLF